MTSDQPVLLAYDGSEGAKAALQAATRLFADRQLIVASVGRSMAAVAPAGAIGLPAGVAGEALARLDEETTRQVEALADEGVQAATAAGLAARAAGTVSDGNVWSAVLRLADDNDAGAIVVGSRGRSGVQSMLLGSVSSAVVHHSARPVVVVPA